jgi:hypothetical protein
MTLGQIAPRLESDGMRLLFVLIAFCIATVQGQQPTQGTAGDAEKLVTIQQIVVEGTRLPQPSVIRLAQIKAGDQVNFLKLHAAMRKVTQSGLISNIDFEYESLPDKETEVVLHLKCTDVRPTAKASIEIPQVNEDDVWTWLGQVDPLFTRELPPNEAAIRLYSLWIEKYMESHGNPKFAEAFAVVADAANASGGNGTDRLIFKVVKRRGVK